MEAAALARKERLKHLKSQDKISATNEIQTESNELTSEQQDEPQIAQPKTAETEAQKMESAALEQLNHHQQQEEIDLDQLVPKKPDWDLKRDLESKINLLERKTRLKIVELVKMRVSQNDS